MCVSYSQETLVHMTPRRHSAFIQCCPTFVTAKLEFILLLALQQIMARSYMSSCFCVPDLTPIISLKPQKCQLSAKSVKLKNNKNNFK